MFQCFKKRFAFFFQLVVFGFHSFKCVCTVKILLPVIICILLYSFDGIINNTPTVDELEAKVKAGEQISLVDLAEAIKADKERGKEKPSIRAQLKADKERAGKKKNAKQKSQDLERS